MSKNKMTKDVIPTDFTLGLAAVDAIPVLFFGASMIVAALLFKSVLFLIGALLCLFAGACKVIWKIIVVLKRQNIWWLFLQVRILMPIGLVLMIIGGILNRSNLSGIGVGVASIVLFVLGLVGMVLMGVFGFALDSSNVRSNWIEQITNGVAQIAFFVGLLLLVI